VRVGPPEYFSQQPRLQRCGAWFLDPGSDWIRLDACLLDLDAGAPKVGLRQTLGMSRYIAATLAVLGLLAIVTSEVSASGSPATKVAPSIKADTYCRE
jgi:hypothetical protein